MKLSRKNVVDLTRLCTWFMSKHTVEGDTKESLDECILAFESFSNYTTSFRIDPDMEKHANELISRADKIIKAYASMSSMSLINEFDSMKKQMLEIFSSIGEIYCEVEVDSKYAEEELKDIRARIALELEKEGIAKSSSEKAARTDQRVMRATADVIKLQKFAKRIRSKRESIDKTLESLKQSVSTARVEMVKQTGQS